MKIRAVTARLDRRLPTKLFSVQKNTRQQNHWSFMGHNLVLLVKRTTLILYSHFHWIFMFLLLVSDTSPAASPTSTGFTSVLNDSELPLTSTPIKDVRWLQFWFFNFRFLSCWLTLIKFLISFIFEYILMVYSSQAIKFIGQWHFIFSPHFSQLLRKF